MPRGNPNRKRQRQIAELRAAGLTYREIGERFGVTVQAIYESLQCSGNTGDVAIRCRKCKTVITAMRLANNRRACCMNCLPPD